MIFPYVREARIRQGRVAYRFWRSEHWRVYGTNDPRDYSDDDYRFEWFVRDMERARKAFTREPGDSPDRSRKKAITQIQLAVARAVENGGREAMQYAVEESKDDPEPEANDAPAQKPDRKPDKSSDDVKKALEALEGGVPDDAPKPKKKTKRKRRKVKGWARVPTGAETCGWCLMLCSRGPVYTSAYTAGLELEDYQAVQMYEFSSEFDSDDMNEWHAGCDCKVVPVFDYADWPGKDEAEEALEMWKEATRLAKEELERNPDKKSYVNGRWIKTTLNREAQNQMRRLAGEYEKQRSSRAA